ncbi:hypothetical protein [Sphaerisporangium aureirubrum]|uniref:Uncharacterized protein n=1 Tax=Sphaerisporangium aureirubrum TaxID=1544736 RepID=A0ABW1NLZ1_9ACTN
MRSNFSWVGSCSPIHSRHPPPIIDEHLIYAVVLAGLALSNVGRLGPPTFAGAALHRFRITASGGMSAGTVLRKPAETAESATSPASSPPRTGSDTDEDETAVGLKA